MRLIIGGSGFLGTNLAQKLLSLGEKVRIYDIRPPRVHASKLLDFVRGDVRDSEAVYDACKNVDLVFNMIPQVIVRGVENVLEASIRTDVSKVVYVSSSMVYGVPKFAPCDESCEPNPVGGYGKSKLQAEKLCKNYLKKGLDITILRPKLIVGPGGLGFLTIIFEWVRRGKNVYIIGSGENRFQMVSVSDVSEACVLASTKGSGEIFNIGSDNVPTVRQQMEALKEHAGTGSQVIPVNATLAKSILGLLSFFRVSPIDAQYYILADKDYVLDTTKAKRILGWTPKHDNIEMTIAAYDWYVQNYKELPSRLPADRGIMRLLKYIS